MPAISAGIVAAALFRQLAPLLGGA
nr:hypothetical protein [uncultured bacterium]